MQLKGKVALVTGASSGIGGAIARRLAASGAMVIATYLDDMRDADEMISDIIEAGNIAQLMQLDQRSPQGIDQVLESITRLYSRLDILINNAAWNISVPFSNLNDLTHDLWDRVLETNLRGPFLLSRACAPLLMADGGGHVVNISSVGGITPIGSSIAYSCSKAGLNHLTRCLAVAMAPAVAVNCIAAGLVENTGMSNRAMDATSQKAMRESTLLGRAAEITDVVDQVMTFIASTSITGQVVAIDGGMPAAMR